MCHPIVADPEDLGVQSGLRDFISEKKTKIVTLVFNPTEDVAGCDSQLVMSKEEMSTQQGSEYSREVKEARTKELILELNSPQTHAQPAGSNDTRPTDALAENFTGDEYFVRKEGTKTELARSEDLSPFQEFPLDFWAGHFCTDRCRYMWHDRSEEGGHDNFCPARGYQDWPWIKQLAHDHWLTMWLVTMFLASVAVGYVSMFLACSINLSMEDHFNWQQVDNNFSFSLFWLIFGL